MELFQQKTKNSKEWMFFHGYKNNTIQLYITEAKFADVVTLRAKYTNK